MRLLVVASMYPHPGLPYSGIFNQNCVDAAANLGHEIVVVAPRPFVPPFLHGHPRWAAYAQIPAYAERNGVQVYRPSLLQIPKFGATFQRNQGAFFQLRNTVKKLHRKHSFDAVFSFDLGAAGGLAWRLGRSLELASTGWAFGLDVRVPHDSSDAAEMRSILRRLDLVFYQSSELRDCAQSYLAHEPLDPTQHVVLPHGIPPQPAARPGTRERIRKELGIDHDAPMILFLSRIVYSKGIRELLTALEFAGQDCPALRCIVVGETAGFDDSAAWRTEIQAQGLANSVQLLPACDPQEVADFHAAADIFVFPSKSEGMPNALLEAMALGTPSVAFDIPPIRDILSHGAGLSVVPSFDAMALGKALSELATSPERRTSLASAGQRVVQEHFDISTNMARALQHLQTTVDQRV